MSIDTSNVRLLEIIPSRMQKAASTGGGEWHGPCPFCGGQDRFIVQPNQSPARWWCRGCDRKGDAIAFMMQYHNLQFAEAVQRLGLESQLKNNTATSKAQPPSYPPAPTTSSANASPDSIPALDNPEYIEKSAAFADWAWRNLQSGNNPNVSGYLEARGLDPVAQDIFMLGYNPYQMERVWGGVLVKLVPGITIPYLDGFEGVPRKIKIRMRTDNPKFKYIAVAGGANWLYNAWRVRADSIVVMCEGEIDAISVSIACRHFQIVPVATGSTGGARLLRWPALLSVAHKVLLAFDDDEPGEAAAKWWANYLLKARSIKPTAHDINDMLTSGQDIRSWIEQGLSK
jgi:DNA primase